MKVKRISPKEGMKVISLDESLKGVVGTIEKIDEEWIVFHSNQMPDTLLQLHIEDLGYFIEDDIAVTINNIPVCHKCGSRNIEIHESVVGVLTYDMDKETGMLTQRDGLQLHDASYEQGSCKDCNLGIIFGFHSHFVEEKDADIVYGLDDGEEESE